MQGMLYVEDDNKEELEIDLNEHEPAFLKGQSTKSGGEVSPVRVVANPDGSLQVMIISKGPKCSGMHQPRHLRHLHGCFDTPNCCNAHAHLAAWFLKIAHRDIPIAHV